MTGRGRLGAVIAWVACAFAAVPALGTPIPLPGFPLKVEGAIRQPITLADVDGDGTLDLVVVTDTKVLVLSTEVHMVAGWPVDLAAITKHPGASLMGPPAVGDIDGDGKPDIALAVSYGPEDGGEILVLNGSGQPLWQEDVSAGLAAGCTLADLTGRHAYDVVAGTRKGQIIALDAHGKSVSGFPARIGAPASSPVAFGGLARGQKPVLAVGATDGKVYVVSAVGQPVPGFPLVTHFVVSGAPAFGDLDDDGQGDLIVASQDYGVYAVKADGTPIPGFPVQTEYRIYGGPALGDIDHDGKMDVVVASTDGKVYAWNNQGRLFPGFPVTAGTKIERDVSVLVADSSRTGKDSIFVTSSDGRVYGFDGTGAPLDGFPIELGQTQITMPAIGDVVRDEAEEMVLGIPGRVVGYRLQRTGNLPQSPLSWAAEAHDSTRASHFGPNPPRYRNAMLNPGAPRRGQPLKLSYEYYSLDGTPEPATRVRWKLNGEFVPELDGAREVPGAKMKRGDRWQATVQAPGDYTLYKDSSSATIMSSNKVTVADTPPTTPKIAVDQAVVSGVVQLKVRFVEQSRDIDGDAVTYTYRWEHEGQVGSTLQTIDANVARKSEAWRVIVTPFDDEREGIAAVAEVHMVNSPPTAPRIALFPQAPTTEDDIRASVVKAAEDVDGDKLTYFYAFFVNDTQLPLPPERPYLPKGVARHGDIVKVECWANDGEADGPRYMVQARVMNAPPTKPEAGIAPAPPHTGDELTGGLKVASRDPDRDPVTYAVRWTRDGQPFGTPGQLVIPRADVHKGQHWAVEFVPSDGTLEGPAATAEVLVANSPPTRLRLKVSNATPLVTEASVVDIAQPSTDPDGDTIRYEYAWTVDGKPTWQAPAQPVVVAGPPATVEDDPMVMAAAATGVPVPTAPPPPPAPAMKTALQPGEFHKHQRVIVSVTAVDTDGARSPAATLEIVPRNTTPTAPKVMLDPAQPTIETGLHVVISTPAQDADGDSLTYRYRWFRNEVEARDIGDRAVLKPGEIKHGEQWRVVVVAFDGEVEGPPAGATATVLNVAPTAPEMAMGPAHASVVTGLACNVKRAAADADGDPIALEYHWLRNAQPFAIPSSSASVPGDSLRSGETWRCDVDAFDGEARSATVSATAVVEDAAPSAPVIEIGPKQPVAGTALVCAVATPSVDPDGERVEYSMRWVPPSGVTLPQLADPSRLPAGLVKKGQTWKCAATATAGKLKTIASNAEARIGNTRPIPPALEIEPEEPEAGTNLLCKLMSEASDVDGDHLTYAFTWYRNGAAQSFSPTSAEVPGRLVKAGDRWTCSIIVNDGLDPSRASHSLDVSVAAKH